MSIKNTISTMYLEARKNKDTIKVNLLSVIVGDINKYEIDNRKDMVDDDVIKLLAKTLKNIDESLSYRKSEVLEVERSILLSLLPQQLSEDEVLKLLETYLYAITMDGGIPPLKDVLVYFKTNYANRYNPKVLKDLYTKHYSI